MDKVVQQNAANAEENASASEEMNAQAEQMQGFVGDLVAWWGGSKRARGPRIDSKSENHEIQAGTGRAAAMHKPVAAKGKKTSPQQLIPLDDDDFSDF